MRKRVLWLGTLALAAITSSDAMAQTCRGMASYEVARMSASANGNFDNNRTGYAAGFSYGSGTFFGGVGIGGMSFSQLGGAGLTVSLGGGYETTVDPRRRVHLCPGANVRFLFGPNNILGSGLDYEETSVLLGASLGGIAGGTKEFHVVPSAGLGFRITTGRLEDGLGNVSSETDSFATIDLGVGLIFNRVVTFKPAIDIPIGLENGQVGVSALLALNFGQPL